MYFEACFKHRTSAAKEKKWSGWNNAKKIISQYEERQPQQGLITD